ncbi:unnamed protein product [Amoebophrya sp. A120]|nr:unnamed protein product [Amoebophrya sp. A120]|eukprot:GSA120T00025863001.1
MAEEHMPHAVHEALVAEARWWGNEHRIAVKAYEQEKTKRIAAEEKARRLSEENRELKALLRNYEADDHTNETPTEESGISHANGGTGDDDDDDVDDDSDDSNNMGVSNVAPRAKRKLSRAEAGRLGAQRKHERRRAREERARAGGEARHRNAGAAGGDVLPPAEPQAPKQMKNNKKNNK